MNLFTWAENGFKKYKWYDVSLLKSTVFFSTLFLITIWDGFAVFVFKNSPYLYLGLAVLFGIVPMLKMFKK